MTGEDNKQVMILAIESSCDETAVAILRDIAGDGNKAEVLCSEISSQIEIHREYGGVVPELASRNHSLALLPLVVLRWRMRELILRMWMDFVPRPDRVWPHLF